MVLSRHPNARKGSGHLLPKLAQNFLGQAPFQISAQERRKALPAESTAIRNTYTALKKQANRTSELARLRSSALSACESSTRALAGGFGVQCEVPCQPAGMCALPPGCTLCLSEMCLLGAANDPSERVLLLDF